MKKLSLLLALSAIASVSHAVTFFDSIYTSATQAAVANGAGTTKSVTFTGSTPRRNMGGVFGVTGTFDLTSLTFAFANFGTATLANQTVGIKIYDALSSSTVTTDNEFVGNNILNTSATFTGVNLSANTYTLGTVTLGTAVRLDAAHNYGIVLSSGTNDVSFGISYGAADYVGSDLGFNGYFRDASDDGVIQVGESRTLGFTNQALALKLDGTQPVPEPSAFAALGLGVVAVLRRRSKKA